MRNFGGCLLLLVVMTACVPRDQFRDLERSYTELEQGYIYQKQRADTLQWYVDRVLPDLMSNGFQPKRISLILPKVVESTFSDVAGIEGEIPLIHGDEISADSLLDIDSLFQGPPKDEFIIETDDSLATKALVSPELSTELGRLSNYGVKFINREGKLVLSLGQDLLFTSGGKNIGVNGMSQLRSVSKVLNQMPQRLILVEGHTDSREPKNIRGINDNWDLSVMRATAVVRELVKLGIKPERIIAGGRSKYAPVAPNTRSSNRLQNRRIEIIITPWKI